MTTTGAESALEEGIASLDLETKVRLRADAGHGVRDQPMSEAVVAALDRFV